ncbi:MAG: hypothetical protein IKW74_00960, partial [Thermoguttaceae bacterium]|nr:hypothetical protein [Thermoguttaceae bacterium]
MVIHRLLIDKIYPAFAICLRKMVASVRITITGRRFVLPILPGLLIPFFLLGLPVLSGLTDAFRHGNPFRPTSGVSSTEPSFVPACYAQGWQMYSD